MARDGLQRLFELFEARPRSSGTGGSRYLGARPCLPRPLVSHARTDSRGRRRSNTDCRACDGVAIFIRADGLGPWKQGERDLALDRQAGEPGFPVIPVLLARCHPGLGFLKLNTGVDLSDGEALAILASAIQREPPGPRGVQPGSRSSPSSAPPV
jgi:hypothetical protein